MHVLAPTKSLKELYNVCVNSTAYLPVTISFNLEKVPSMINALVQTQFELAAHPLMLPSLPIKPKADKSLNYQTIDLQILR